MFALQHYTAVKLIMCRLIVCHRPRHVGEMWTTLSFQVLNQSVAAVSMCVWTQLSKLEWKQMNI